MARILTYRRVRKAYKMLKYGPTVGNVQYMGRQVWRVSKTEPGGNYANPKRRRG